MAKTYKNLYLGDMNPGDDVEGFFLLTAANVKSSTKGGQYLAGKLKDKTSELDFKVWDYQADIHEHVGAIVKIRGSVSEYNGALQLIVERIRLAQQGDPYSMNSIIPAAPIDLDQAANEVEKMLSGIKDPVYHAIALTAFDHMKGFLKTLPAGKTVHHAFIGGWLMHTQSMMNMAYAVCEAYDFVNLDLLLCGVFCHDIGKKKEFLLSEIGLVTDYTVKGHLLGHLYMGALEVSDIAGELQLNKDDERVVMLQHMLLSHHGNPECGAAVTPRFMEAEILSLLDLLDSRIEIYRETYSSIAPGEMSDYVKALGRALYKHH